MITSGAPFSAHRPENTHSMHLVRQVFSFLLIFPALVFADYGWIPEPERLHTRFGIDFVSTSNNFGNDGALTPVTFSAQSSTFADRAFWLDSEFGIAEDWAALLKLSFVNAGVTSDASQTLLAAGSGFGDLRAGLKWRFSREPLWTVEGYFKLPTGVSVPSAGDEIVNGEGNIDLGLKLHFGYQTGNIYLSASPGFVGRFGGYSSAFTADAAVQMFIYRAYAKAFLSSIFSLSAQALNGGVLTDQVLAGSGGSYARLAGSPTMITAGASVGVLISKSFRLEGQIVKTVWGQRSPDVLGFTVSLLGLFDFSKPDLRPKVREVPFEDGQGS